MSDPPASFYFDLANPLAYLAAERVLTLLPRPLEWQPVLARELPSADSYEGFRCREEIEIFRAGIARRAQDLSLQPLRWPEPFPFDSALAMRVATYAKSIGRAVAFAQAAFRQAFAGGRSLEEPNNVLIAAAACEMHPAATLAGSKLRSIERQLLQASARAAEAGVLDVPAVIIGEQLFVGERAVEHAAAQMGASRSTHTGASATSAGSR